MTARLTTYFQFFIVLVFLVCAQSSAVAQKYPFTGKQLFEGIYFSDGPVANEIQVLRDNSFKKMVKDRNVLAAARRFQQELIDRITINHPTFYDEFGKQIATRDHKKILSALERANEIFYDEMVGLMYDKTGNTQTSNQEQELKYLRNFLDAYASLDNIEKRTAETTIEEEQNLIAVALVWVLAVAWEYAWVSDEFVIPNAARMDEGGLKQEQLVAELADI